MSAARLPPTAMVSPEGAQDGDRQAAPRPARCQLLQQSPKVGPGPGSSLTASEQSAELSERLPLRLEF